MDFGSNSYLPGIWALNTYYVQGFGVHAREDQNKKKKVGLDFFSFNQQPPPGRYICYKR